MKDENVDLSQLVVKMGSKYLWVVVGDRVFTEVSPFGGMSLPWD